MGKLFNYSETDKYKIHTILGIRITLKKNNINQNKNIINNISQNNVFYKLNKDFYYKLHFGPGPGFIKPDNSWINVDIDKNRGDVVLNFNENQELPFEDGSVEGIYASHVFEHMSIYAAPKVFRECYRVLKVGGVLRIIIPHVRRGIERYLQNDYSYEAFVDNKKIGLSLFRYKEYTIFEALKAEFISPTGQRDLLGNSGLAHQNAWDFESLQMDLKRAGFNPNNVIESGFKKSKHSFFNFEGSYQSTANKYERSLYVEVIK